MNYPQGSSLADKQKIYARAKHIDAVIKSVFCDILPQSIMDAY